MTCHEFEFRLDERLHRGLAVDAPDLHAHKDSCAACRWLLEGAVLVQQGVAALKTRPMSADMADRVLAAWSVEQRPQSVSVKARSSRFRWQPRLGLSAAAAALLLLTLRGGIDSPQHEPTRSVASTPAESPDASVDELVRSAKSAYLALAQDAAHTFRDAVQVVLPSHSPLDGIPVPTDFKPWKPTLPKLPDVHDAFSQWLDRG